MIFSFLEKFHKPTPAAFSPIQNFENELIHGDKFVECADYQITEHNPAIPKEILTEDCTIFCKADYLPTLFKFIKASTQKYILISHNADTTITDDLYKIKPASIKYWFAQNCMVTANDIESIPIGLERPHIAPQRDTKAVMINLIQKKKVIRNLLYMNHRNATNRDVRAKIKRKLRWYSFVTYKKGRAYCDYMEDIYSHKFVISPPGNGVDCHRTWESLYLGTIPVVQADNFPVFCSEIPVLIVKSISKIKKQDLLEFDTPTQSKVLAFSFWKSRIDVKKHELLSR